MRVLTSQLQGNSLCCCILIVPGVQPDADHWVNTIDILAHCLCSAQVCPSGIMCQKICPLLNTHQPIKFPVAGCVIGMAGSMSSTSQWACKSLFICRKICYHHISSIDQVSKLAWKLWGSLVYCSSSWDKTRMTWLRCVPWEILLLVIPQRLPYWNMEIIQSWQELIGELLLTKRAP